MTHLKLVFVVGLVVALLSPSLASSAPAPEVTNGVYLSDVRAGTGALQHFGSALSNAQSVSALAGKSVSLRRYLFQFDRRFYVIGRYRLSAPALNSQRARLARTAPGVTYVLSEFLDAIITQDTQKIDRLVPKVTARISAFEAAATI